MVDESDRVIDATAEFTAKLFSEGVRTENIINALVVNATMLAIREDLQDYLLELLDIATDKAEESLD